VKKMKIQEIVDNDDDDEMIEWIASGFWSRLSFFPYLPMFQVS
jgi:hypothetical protein